MDFMVIFIHDREPRAEDPSVFADMGKFAGELAQKGKMRGGSPLHPEVEGARVRVANGNAMVTDGPFAETKEIIGGFFMVDCDSREEAVEIARRCPHGRIGTVEVRQVIPMGPGS